jgi:hypothetical protein
MISLVSRLLIVVAVVASISVMAAILLMEKHRTIWVVAPVTIGAIIAIAASIVY